MAENPPNTQLEAFLSGAPEPEPQQAPPAAPEPKAPEPPKEPPAAPTPKPDDDDAEPPEATPGEPVVPRRALEDERHKRQNYVAQAAKFEAERDMLAKQLEELKKAPPQAQPQAQPQYQPINPAEDPAGYHARLQGALLNERLNVSELLLRKELGAEKVDAAIAEFKQHAERDPRLYSQLYQQTDPYGWMAQEVDRLRLIREVTTDPAGYEAKLRAKWEAEAADSGNGQQAPRVSPVANLPPSLANARSALPRSSAAFTGPQSLDDILGQRTTHNTRH